MTPQDRFGSSVSVFISMVLLAAAPLYTAAQVVEAPVVEAPVVEAPAVEAPAVEAPVAEAPVAEAPVADLQAVGSQAVDASAEGVVHELYGIVTFPAGATPDWDELRALFLPEAVVVLRSSREATSVFSLEGFVQDWLRFIEGSDVIETGFTERIIRTHSTEFGDIAHVWVLYEAEIPGWGRPPQPGVDSFQLVRREGEWKIASITNEVPTPDRPIPELLRDVG